MNKNKLISKLEKDKIIVGDGAMGTLLQNRGLDSGEAPEKWNLTHPEEILSIHQDYIVAGADLLETNTFGGNYVRLKESELEDKIEEINKTAVELAKKAGKKETIISGSVGPTGKMIKPLGVLSQTKALESYKKQISILVQNEVDAIQIETMVDLNEIEQALKAASQFEIPVIAQINFQESGATVMGHDISDSVELLKKYDVTVIGINCTPGAKKTLPLIRKLNQTTDKPLSVFPNAGEPELKEGEVTYPEGPEDFKPYVSKYINNNVKIMGGCCGTTPEVIAAIKKQVNHN